MTTTRVTQNGAGSSVGAALMISMKEKEKGEEKKEGMEGKEEEEGSAISSGMQL